MDFGFVSGKLQLGHGIILLVTRVVVYRGRRNAIWQAPGVDLLARRDGSTTVASAIVVIDAGFTVPACIPNEAVSVVIAARPPMFPGKQTLRRVSQAPGCVNSTDAPLMTRCWAAVTAYDDGAYSAVDIVNGTAVPAQYVLRTLRAAALCERVLDSNCARVLGLVGCFVQTMQAAEAAEAPNSTAGGGGAATTLAGAGSDSDGVDSDVLLAALLGGVLGGLALLGVVILGALLWMRRQQPQQPQQEQQHCACASKQAPGFDTETGVSFMELYKHLTPASSTAIGTVITEVPTTDKGSVASLRVAKLDYSHLPVTTWTPPDPNINLDADLVNLSLVPGKILGKGTYGRVQLGTYGRPPLPVAVKLLDLGLPTVLSTASHSVDVAPTLFTVEAIADHKNADAEEVNELAKALQQEVAILARCQHANVVKLLASNLTCRQPCLVMELMDTSLDKLLYGGETPQLLPMDTVLHIGLQVAAALAYLHPTIIHRDLKPANVLLSHMDSPHPTVKLGDFGLSRLLSTVLVTANAEVGTAPYMAPETFNVDSLGEISDRADMYSYGVLLWEMCSGCRPWAELRNMVAVAYTVSLCKQRLSLDNFPADRCPPKLRALLRDCFEEDPARRPAAADAAKALQLCRQALRAHA